MFPHRFQEQISQQAFQQSQLPTCQGFAFMPFPCLEADGAGTWMQWLYQMAFEEARNDVLAARRARMLMASLN